MEEIINLEETYSIAGFHAEVNIQLVKTVGDEKTVLRVDECFLDPGEIESFQKEWLRLEHKLNGWSKFDELVLDKDWLSRELEYKVCLELKVWIPSEDLKDPLVLKCKIKDKLEEVRQLFNTAKESREEKLGLIKSLLSSED